MCTQDIISVCCPTCGDELSYRYTPLEACGYRGQCYVRRTAVSERAPRKCESCAQKTRETEFEARRRDAERNKHDMSEEAEREADRDRNRKADRRRVEKEREKEQAATIRESRQRREKEREAEEMIWGTWTGNKRKYR